MARGGGQDLPRAETLPTAKASRHGARAKGFAPRENAPHGEGLPTRRTGERICPAQERSPRRRPPDTAHGRKDLPRAETLPSAKASRHGARAKGFAPRRNMPLGEGLPTRREGERICPAQEHAPRRKPPDTAHGRKGLPRGVRVRPTCRRTAGRPRPTNSRKNTPSAKAYRHGARAKGFAPRENALLGEGLPTRRTSKRICPAGVRPRPTCRRTADRPRPTDSRKNTPSAGSHPRGRGRGRIHSPKKIRLLHEIQLFYGESHVGSRQIFSSFPSVGRCVARERNPVPPVAPHCGSGHRGLRRDGEMCHGFDEMVRRFDECPHGGELLPRAGNAWLLGGGRYCPGLRCFGERFHRRCRANPDACRAPRCSRG